MTQDLALISRGEPQWDNKVNAAITRLNEVVGVTNQLQWTKGSSEGIVFLNGWQGQVSYSYSESGGEKLVDLQVAIKGNAKAAQYTEALALPDIIVPTNRMIQKHYWNIIAEIMDNKLGIRSDVDLQPGKDWSVVTDFIYKI